MPSVERLKQKKIAYLLKAYDSYKKAEAAGTLRKVLLSDQQEPGMEQPDGFSSPEKPDCRNRTVPNDDWRRS